MCWPSLGRCCRKWGSTPVALQNSPNQHCSVSMHAPKPTTILWCHTALPHREQFLQLEHHCLARLLWASEVKDVDYQMQSPVCSLKELSEWQLLPLASSLLCGFSHTYSVTVFLSEIWVLFVSIIIFRCSRIGVVLCSVACSDTPYTSGRTDNQTKMWSLVTDISGLRRAPHIFK